MGLFSSLRGHAGLLLVIVVGLAARLVVAPYTSGSDIPQFAGFADSFLRHGLDFYLYVTGDNAGREGWAYPWPYVYGPLTILMLAAVRLAAPGSVYHGFRDGSYVVLAPRDWIVAAKLLFIFWDTVSAVLVYLVALRLSGSRGRAAGAALLYYWNPMVAYISAVYGMLDPVMLAFMLAGILLLLDGPGRRGRWLAGLSLIGLSLAVKPTAVYVVLPLAFYALLRHGPRRGVEALLAPLLVALAVYAPFLLRHGALRAYLEAVRSVACPCYSVPVVYSFNGIMSIAFYAWNHLGVNTSYVLGKWPLLFAPTYIAALASAWRSRSPVVPVALGYITYTATYWRVNHQYLVPTAAFAALLLVELGGWPRRLSLLTLALIGLWPLMYPISFWARVHIASPNPTIVKLLDSTSLAVFDELAYIYYALALTASQLLLIAVTTLQTGPRPRELLEAVKRLIEGPRC